MTCGQANAIILNAIILILDEGLVTDEAGGILGNLHVEMGSGFCAFGWEDGGLGEGWGTFDARAAEARAS